MFSSILGIGPHILPQLLAIATLVATILICGCSLNREPGPAERIGRSIDEISDALEDMNTEDEKSTGIARRSSRSSSREEEAARRRREREMSDEEFWSQEPEQDREAHGRAQASAEPFVPKNDRGNDRY